MQPQSVIDQVGHTAIARVHLHFVTGIYQGPGAILLIETETGAVFFEKPAIRAMFFIVR